MFTLEISFHFKFVKGIKQNIFDLIAVIVLWLALFVVAEVTEVQILVTAGLVCELYFLVCFFKVKLIILNAICLLKNIVSSKNIPIII